MATGKQPTTPHWSEDTSGLGRPSTVKLFDDPNAHPEDALIKDSLKRVREQLAQIPEGKTGALVIAVDYKFGIVPTLRTGVAHRTANGWEIHGEAFISKAEKGASVRAVKTW